MYRVYEGNSGRSRRVTEGGGEGRFMGKTLAPLPEKKAGGGSGKTSGGKAKPPGPETGLSGELAKLMGKLGSLSLETEDLLLIAVLYLMYRESGDRELLIMIGALLLL